MAGLYKHRRTESIDVPYSFRCEQCMRDSGLLKARISADAEMRSNFRNLSSAKQRRLRRAAHANLVRTVKSAYAQAEKKHIYCKDFKDECPYCDRPQSWAISRAKKNMFSTPVIFVMLGAIFGAGCYFFSGVENAQTIAFIMAGSFGAIALAVLVARLARLRKKKKEISPAARRNLPVIDWRSVRNILNER